MAITQKSVTIDGQDYMLSAFPATKGVKVFKLLAKLIGPAFQALTQAENEEAASALAIAKLLESMEEVAVEDLLKDLMVCVSKNNMAINFDTEFQADYGKLVKLAQEVVQLNYGSLFTMLGTVAE